MSLDSKEKSLYDSAPIELYQFTCNTQTWYYADWDQDFSVGAATYLCLLPHSRNNPEFSQEDSHSQLNISTTIEHPVVDLMIKSTPHDPIWITIFVSMIGESETRVVWQGKVIGCKVNEETCVATLVCDPVDKLIGKSIFRQTFGPMCRKRLYSTSCGVSEALFTSDFTVQTISASGLIVTAAAFDGKPDNWWRFGDIWIPGLRRWGSIERSSGNSITLRTKVPGLAVGHSGKVKPGCDHLYKRSGSVWGDCKAKFDNTINFGGFAHTGLKNPYILGLEG